MMRCGPSRRRTWACVAQIPTEYARAKQADASPNPECADGRRTDWPHAPQPPRPLEPLPLPHVGPRRPARTRLRRTGTDGELPALVAQSRRGERVDDRTGTVQIRLRTAYALHVTTTEAVPDPRRGLLEVALHGDLEGWARWTYAPRRTRRRAHRALYEQEVEVRTPLIRRLSLPGRPVFRLNHALMMRAAARPRGPGWPLLRKRLNRPRGFCTAWFRAISSAGEHFVHTEGVTGSIPVSPTGTGRSV